MLSDAGQMNDETKFQLNQIHNGYMKILNYLTKLRNDVYILQINGNAGFECEEIDLYDCLESISKKVYKLFTEQKKFFRHLLGKSVKEKYKDVYPWGPIYKIQYQQTLNDLFSKYGAYVEKDKKAINHTELEENYPVLFEFTTYEPNKNNDGNDKKKKNGKSYIFFRNDYEHPHPMNKNDIIIKTRYDIASRKCIIYRKVMNRCDNNEEVVFGLTDIDKMVDELIGNKNEFFELFYKINFIKECDHKVNCIELKDDFENVTYEIIYDDDAKNFKWNQQVNGLLFKPYASNHDNFISQYFEMIWNPIKDINEIFMSTEKIKNSSGFNHSILYNHCNYSLGYLRKIPQDIKDEIKKYNTTNAILDACLNVNISSMIKNNDLEWILKIYYENDINLFYKFVEQYINGDNIQYLYSFIVYRSNNLDLLNMCEVTDKNDLINNATIQTIINFICHWNDIAYMENYEVEFVRIIKLCKNNSSSIKMSCPSICEKNYLLLNRLLVACMENNITLGIGFSWSGSRFDEILQGNNELKIYLERPENKL